MSVSVTLPDHYGAVILTFVASIVMLLWKGFQVGKARKQFNVQYPTMYSATNDHFNCYQRAHQNTLEVYPYFLALLFIGGIECPLLSAVCGLIWVAARVSYALGYYTGEPKNRMKGVYGYIGLLILLGINIKMGFSYL